MPLRWADIDTYGHVNNAVNYLLMDTLINGWLGDQTGVDIRNELPGFAVVVETGCVFFREMHFDSPLVLGLRLERVSTSSVQYEVGFFIDDHGPAAVGRFVHVYIDPDSRRPVPVPDVVRTVLQSIETPTA
jgi:acyl-CoA thioester hydrolase